MDDRQIIEMYLARDEQAIAVTQGKYGAMLRQMIYRITEDADAVGECENDTYLQIWNLIPPQEPYEYLGPFLSRIARHIAIDYCRHRSRAKRSAIVEELSLELQESIPSGRTPEDQISDDLLRELINDYLMSISPEKRAIFVRRYWYADSIEEIADGFGLTKSNIKIILFRCRRQLKKILEKEGYVR